MGQNPDFSWPSIIVVVSAVFPQTSRKCKLVLAEGACCVGDALHLVTYFCFLLKIIKYNRRRKLLYVICLYIYLRQHFAM